MFVGLLARSHHQLEETVEIIEVRGGKAIAHTTDVRSPDSVSGAVRSIRSQLGGIDLLVNNVGGRQAIGKLWERRRRCGGTTSVLICAELHQQAMRFYPTWWNDDPVVLSTS
jgi:NAD(P)-dependent dehydrogenase (short-subunit alcohol dehydrogenase family)